MAFRISIAPSGAAPLRILNNYFWLGAVVTFQSGPTGGPFSAAPGELVTVSFTPSAGATVLAYNGTSGPVSGITDASGQWIATFVSTTPGVIGFHASHPASGTATGTGLPNSPDATYSFSDARISLSPLITTVTAGTSVTITALTEFNNFGAGWNNRTTSATITWTLLNLDGAVASPGGPLTGTSITFTSSTPGQVRVRATSNPTNSPNIVGAQNVQTGNDQKIGLLNQIQIPNPPNAIVNFI